MGQSMMEATISYQQKRLRYAGFMGMGSLIASIPITILLLSDQTIVRWFEASTTDAAQRMISLSGVCVLLALFITPVVTLAGYRLFSHESDLLTDVEKIIERGRQYWVLRLGMSFVMTFTISLGTMLLFFFIEQLFRGAEMTVVAGVIIAVIYGGLLGYSISFYISGLREQNLMRLSGAIFIAGLVASFLIVQDPEWWRNSLSFLGHAPGSNVIFNLTLISVGLVALTFVRDVLDDLSVLVYAEKFPQRGYNIIRYGLVSTAILIMGIGIYPSAINSLSDFLHNAIANILSLIVVLGMFLLRWIAPDVYPKRFVQQSLYFGIACVVFFVLHYILGVINFVVFEIVLFMAFGIWLYLFMQETKTYIRQQDVDQMQSIIAQNVAAES